MPRWTNELPDATSRPGFSLKRTPPDRPLKAIVTSAQLLVCFTHWWTGRTTPCEAPDCDACKALMPSRPHCYLSAIEQGTREHFLFECTAKAALPFKIWLQTYPTLRGCFFTASRPKRRRNAQVEILCKPFDLSTIQLPMPPDIARAMSVIWQLPTTALEPSSAIDSVQELKIDPTTMNRMRLNPADGLPKPSPSNGKGAG